MQELMNYQNRKEEIRKKLRETVDNFVYIGYQLKQVLENKEYEQDGYTDIVEFANREYGLSADDTYRFIRINTRYSIGGNSPELDTQYKGIAQSKLSEMLSLPDTDLDLIKPDTKREDIRELNRFNKQVSEHIPEAAAGVLQEIITEFFRKGEGRPDVHEMLLQLLNIEKGITGSAILSREELIQECINPNGNGTFRKGKYMLFMYKASDGMKYKVFGDNENHEVTYDMFAKTTHLFFCVANQIKEGMDEWESFYGKEPAKPKPKEPEPVKEARKPEPKKVAEEPKVPVSPVMKEKTPESQVITGAVAEAKVEEKVKIVEPVDNLERDDEFQEIEKSYPQKSEENETFAPAQLDTETSDISITEVIENPYKEYKNIAAMSLERIQEELSLDNYESAYKAGKELIEALGQMLDLKNNQDAQMEGQMAVEDYEA